LLSARASAAVKQPSGESMPQPANANEVSCCVTGRGFPADADTLDGLFKYHVDPVTNMAGGDATMDATRDAQTTPGTFSPQCGLSGTIVLKGGDCKNELRWYNATMPATKPAATALYPLVPADLQLPPMNCMENGFCPLATRMTSQTGQHTWADPLPEYAAAIRTDSHWAKGQVGFALVPTYVNGQAQGKCTQVKYSQAELNDHSPSGAPWITTLIYQSVSNPNAYYIAFEDLPTCAASWRGCQPGGNMPITDPTQGCDGDFNDFVFYVSGLTCSGGGQPCAVTGQMGICAGGVTECNNGGMGTYCRQAVTPTTEVCDGVDNDCNGMVDDNVTCPDPGFVCAQGVCVHPCDMSEFACIAGYTCDTDGLCKDTRCIGKVCGTDQVCKAGTCVGGCDGVMCPHGQVCRVGTCVDPCAGITCDNGRVCEDGACQPKCGDCRDCATGKMCTTTGPNTGVCQETGCQNKTCPAGQVCNAGNCQDGCTGVVCPGGQACMNGSCSPVPMPDAGAPPPPPTDAGSSGTAGSGASGRGGSSGTAGATGAGGAGTGGASGAGGAPHIGGVTACNCDAAGGSGSAGLALMLAAFLWVARRRRAATVRASRP
jgi:uncharacterized protein (TIGR03382 family)